MQKIRLHAAALCLTVAACLALYLFWRALWAVMDFLSDHFGTGTVAVAITGVPLLCLIYSIAISVARRIISAGGNRET